MWSEKPPSTKEQTQSFSRAIANCLERWACWLLLPCDVTTLVGFSLLLTCCLDRFLSPKQREDAIIVPRREHWPRIVVLGTLSFCVVVGFLVALSMVSASNASAIQVCSSAFGAHQTIAPFSHVFPFGQCCYRWHLVSNG